MKKFLLGAVIAISSSAVSAVTEQEALASPDDVQLNRTFAQEQFAQGNYQKALEGIERVIIAKPLDLSARFFRINLMVVLNRGSEVRDELQTILGLALPEADLQRARDLLTAIDRKSAKFNGRVTAKFGFEYDDNINGWSDIEQDGTGTEVRDQDSNGFREQLDDTAFVASLAFSGNYALTDDKATLLKFSSLVRSKNFSDYIQKEQDLTSVSLGLSHKFGGLTGEIGASNTQVDKVNKIVKVGATEATDFTTDVEVNSAYVNLNYRVSPSLSVNYRYTAGKNDNDGIAQAQAVKYDVDTKSHALTALTPLTPKLLLQVGYTYAETRNQNQANDPDVSFEARELTDADTSTVTGALFYTLSGGDSLSGRLSWSNTENLYPSSIQNLVNDTDKTTVSVEYRTDLGKHIAVAEGWTLGASVKSVLVDSNNANLEKPTNTVNAFIERKWDIWK